MHNDRHVRDQENTTIETTTSVEGEITCQIGVVPVTEMNFAAALTQGTTVRIVAIAGAEAVEAEVAIEVAVHT